MGRRFWGGARDGFREHLRQAGDGDPFPYFLEGLSTCSPTKRKADTVLGLDLIAPEGYGEIIGGSMRIHDPALLQERIEGHDLPEEAFKWYMDVRRYGTYPHGGFGMGLERFRGLDGRPQACAKRPSPIPACCTASILIGFQ